MPAEPFADNWSYLKVELNWLERLLLTAVARQKKDLKDIDRVARSAADRTTSHWWKGIVSLEGVAAYDSPAKPKPSEAEGKVASTLEERLWATQTAGVVLAMPALCDRLTLSPFEKSLVLMALAPEVNRRYAQLYGFLQTKEQCEQLPTVDLVMKLFCRNDSEWRVARSRLTLTSPLNHHHLINLETQQAASLLSRSLKLADPLVNFLLAEQPNLADLTALLTTEGAALTREATQPITSLSPLVLPEDATPAPGPPTRPLLAPATPIASPTPPLPHPPSPLALPDLILPPDLLATLQHLCDRCQFAHQVDTDWGFHATAPGPIALFVGAAGTGKTAAARAIAQILQQPLQQIDLAILLPTHHAALIAEIATQNPPVLLLKSADIWLKRSAPLTTAALSQFLANRLAHGGLTLLSSHRLPALNRVWRSAQPMILSFPRPDQAARLRLWQQAFPPSVPLDQEIEWEWLAQKFALSGGEIQARARSAAIYAAADAPTNAVNPVTMHHIRQALAIRSR